MGKGSTFTVVLPVSQQMAAEPGTEAAKAAVLPAGAQLPDDTQAAGQHAADISPAEAGQRQKMLIVDDSDDMVDFLSENFREKYEVLTAGDGIEALDVLSKHEINIIISDWMMPRMDGAELCRRVRRNPLTSHIPFVMLTAKTDDDSKPTSRNPSPCNTSRPAFATCSRYVSSSCANSRPCPSSPSPR